MFAVRTRTGERLVVKVARTEAGHASLARAAEAQRAIADIAALGSWRAKVPEVRSDGQAGAWRFVVETALAGRRLAPLTSDDADQSVTLSAALAAIDELHSQTASTSSGRSRRIRWVEDRVAVAVTLESLVARRDPGIGAALVTGLNRLETGLGEVVGVRELSSGWIHGDYWSANILVDDAGIVSGIVDWDSAEPDELAAHDVFHLVLYARALRRHGGLGGAVADLLGASPLDPGELVILERASPPELGLRATALLYWLRLVESNLRRQPALATSEHWIASNVGAVVPWL